MKRLYQTPTPLTNANGMRFLVLLA